MSDHHARSAHHHQRGNSFFDRHNDEEDTIITRLMTELDRRMGSRRDADVESMETRQDADVKSAERHWDEHQRYAAPIDRPERRQRQRRSRSYSRDRDEQRHKKRAPNDIEQSHRDQDKEMMVHPDRRRRISPDRVRQHGLDGGLTSQRRVSRGPSRSRSYSRSRSRSRSRYRKHTSHKRHRSKAAASSSLRKQSHSSGAFRRGRGPLPSQEESFRSVDGNESGAMKKQKPNFRPSGLLVKEANRVHGTDIVLKYHEPDDARQPPASQDWRLYIFKCEKVLETIPLQMQSCWLIGSQTEIADIRVDHTSASKQHAVVQFRHLSTKINDFGDTKASVKPYIIDLNSSNGTELNGDRIGTSRFIEVKSGDMIKIGQSDCEYVFMLPPSNT